MDNPKKDQAPELTPEQQAYMDFIRKHKDRCSQWALTHGNTNFPIVKLSDGSLVWANRKMRRK